MLTTPFSRGRRYRRRGVALVIVLAFVLLLTAIAIAFFSRSVSERQISNLAVNQIKADALALGAANTVVSDLRQEIAAGSSVYVPSLNYKKASGATREANPLYVPQVPADMVPTVVLVGAPTPTPAPGAMPDPGLANLVKQSAGGQSKMFFPTGGSYDAADYAPSNRAAVGSGSNTSGSPWENSSARPSLNGRFVSPARWNKPLLLPATSATDLTPKLGAGTSWLAPDWVLVARSGANPTTWDKSLVTSAGNDTSVVGRFAYNVYDEGGLLDANVAGFPAPSAQSTPAPDGSTNGNFGYYKTALAYADLTQLTDATGNQLLTQAQVDALVGWRNGGSTNAPAAFPSPAFTDVSRSAYYQSTLVNPTGFLTVGLPGKSSTQFDRMLPGRQTLISLMKTIAAQIPGSDLAKVQDSLRFLGNFGRDLNQPSFVRFHSVPTETVSPGYDSTYPSVLLPSQGGNNAGGDTSGSGTAPRTPRLDTQINPSFLAVRVPTTQARARNDGTDLVQGEPLVKKRFALNRLAWLTYNGPSANNLTDQVVVATIQALAGTSDTSDPAYQSVLQFVQQGNDTNIQKYFGLTWSNGVWLYNVHNGGGTGSGAIMKVGRPPGVTTPDGNSFVQDATNPPREPDFFELLKASINVGSIAKAATSPPSSAYLIGHFKAQYETDSRVDDAVMQIGANIIDQFDLDNFPTRISFNDGSNGTAREFRGVENLPYLYDVQPAVLKVVAPATTPAFSTAGGSASSYYWDADSIAGSNAFSNPPTNTVPTYALTNTGIGATLLIPELWNPHDWNEVNSKDPAYSQKINQTLGVSGPTSFRMYAQSDGALVLQAKYGDQATGSATNIMNNAPGYVSAGFPKAGESHAVDVTNSQLTFNISHDSTGVQLFREPTLLYRPGHPIGSGLAAPPIAGKSANLGVLASGVPAAFSGGGLLPLVGDLSFPPVVGTPYIGMYLGSVPLIWRNQPAVSATPTAAELTIYRDRFVTLDTTLYKLGVPMGFYLQYEYPVGSGNWVTYDEKHVTLGHKGIGYGKISAPIQQPWAGFLEPLVEGDRHYFVLDPRTSRFAMQVSSVAPDTANSYSSLNTWGWPPYSKTFYTNDFSTSSHYQRWMDPSNYARSATGPSPAQNEGILPSLRDGWSIGTNVQMLDYSPGDPYNLVPANFPTQMGYYPGNSGSGGSNGPLWGWKYAQYSFRPGLLSENVPLRMWSDRLCGDNEQTGSSGAGTYNNTKVAPQFFADADGVVRRGMGGWADVPTTDRTGAIGVWANNYAELMGLPMRRAHVFSTTDNLLHKTDIFRNYPPSVPSTSAPLLATESRPMILNRPFRSVAELGYTFSGTPWRNLTFNAPESGDSALLDVFCINDTSNTDGLVAGKVNLNTRQPAVLRAIIAGAYRNESDATLSSASSGMLANTLAMRLVARTTGVIPAGVTITGTTVRPLQNLSDLVGRWAGSPKTAGFDVPGNSALSQPPYDSLSFDGFSADLFNQPYSADPNSKTSVTRTNDTDPSDPVVTSYPDTPSNPATTTSNYFVYDKTVGRHREAPIRALANVGQTRVWNLLIDVVAQTGRYPQNATALDKFLVEGEQRYWVHVAIDRYTGNVIDKQVEVVTE